MKICYFQKAEKGGKHFQFFFSKMKREVAVLYGPSELEFDDLMAATLQNKAQKYGSTKSK